MKKESLKLIKMTIEEVPRPKNKASQKKSSKINPVEPSQALTSTLNPYGVLKTLTTTTPYLN